ncbi:two component system response regulator [Mycolicibacterium canariasense]|uniref:Two component system response regulator n=1 Tax=Mycolicibacterium canariasense TaxID=228230 RepID=A0A100WDH9_MYCCR|nr:GAF and ANTAR domain-containing protein [Mycolicibacterium canariasense]MCV7207968.1 GAF and ANTAR domain-containing protein [Mycolicibacterium canariasense]ORV04997.1 histidine kinase [Mycolicibacterium canariasense]GAS95964.1 two component system response regulator [Mycolicibacterium canariasense]
MTSSDRRTDASLPAAAADQDAAEAADLVVAAAVGVQQVSATELGRMLLAVNRSVVDEDELLSLLQNLAQIAQEAIPGADSTGVTIDLGGHTYTAVHTDQRTLRVDSEQYDSGEGPCLEAARTRQIMLVDAEEAAATWPQFAAAARAEGIRSFLAAPLVTADQTLGSLNLYGRSRSAFDSFDAEILDLLTESVSRAIGDFARYRSAQDVATGLQRALETRAPIEQAKGMLMAIHGIDADEAFERLRRESQNTNIPLRAVALRLVERLTSAPDDEAV